MSARNAVYRFLRRSYYASEARLHLLGLCDLRRLLPHDVIMTAFPQRMFGLVANWNVVLERQG